MTVSALRHIKRESWAERVQTGRRNSYFKADEAFSVIHGGGVFGACLLMSGRSTWIW